VETSEKAVTDTVAAIRALRVLDEHLDVAQIIRLLK